MPDGFASNSYLYPYKVHNHTSRPERKNNVFYASALSDSERHDDLETCFGKRYDDRANDQDWILYYATVLQ